MDVAWRFLVAIGVAAIAAGALMTGDPENAVTAMAIPVVIGVVALVSERSWPVGILVLIAASGLIRHMTFWIFEDLDAAAVALYLVAVVSCIQALRYPTTRALHRLAARRVRV